MGYILGAVAVVAGAAIWAVLVEPRFFRVRRLVLDASAAGLPEMSILHVTDTHFHGRDGAVLQFLERIAAERTFDLILWTGDLIDRPAGLPSLERAAAALRGRVGSFAVLGGHDHYQYSVPRSYAHVLRGRRVNEHVAPNPVEEVVRILRDAGVEVLNDANALARLPGGARLAVVGLRDAYVFEPDTVRATAGLPGGVPVLLIAHSPDVIALPAARAVRAAFFGHTHGGQVRLPFLGALVTHSALPRRTARGLFRIGGTLCVVNCGVGMSPATPFRFLCRPEVVVAELRAQPGGEALSPVREVQVG